MKLSRSRLFIGVPGGLLLLAALAMYAVLPAQASHSAIRAARVVKTTTANVLVTPKGHTLYVFASDPQKKSTCYDTCAKFWPPRLVASGTHPRTNIPGVPGTFGVITRTDGKQQLTYDGAPLYTFLEDKKAGDMNGQGAFASGGYWWAVVAAGK